MQNMYKSISNQKDKISLKYQNIKLKQAFKHLLQMIHL